MRKRNNQITIRLQPKHHKKVKKKAEKVNMSISAFIRNTVMESEFYDLSNDEYIEMEQQVKEVYFEIKKTEFKASYERCLSMESWINLWS